MRYQRLTEDSSMIITETGESQIVSSSLHTNRNICHVRKYLLTLLVYQWISTVILFIIAIHLLIEGRDSNYRQGLRLLVPAILSFIYYTCGLIVIYLIHHIGVYVFVWFGFLQYISLCFEAFLNTIVMIKYQSTDQEEKISFYSTLTIIVISFSQTIFMVVTMKFTFKLLRLIKNFQRDILAQM
ncbi:hypothetical protein I4U23_029551 [Adineta vaga]|nr:hypothetical protein I4U23_029551 [Adineta vaga]